MIVSHSLRLIFVSNPKAASKSIEAALEYYNDEPQLNELYRDGFYTKCHMPASVLREHLPQAIWQLYFKFAIIRNPWDWFVSQHFYNLRKRGIQADRSRKLAVQDIFDTYGFLKQFRGVDWSQSGSQNSFLCDNQGSVLVDFLGRFEGLQADLGKALEKSGASVVLPHLNRTDHAYYKSYYTCETKALIARLYEDDVRIFGYRF
jgi:sulfotransferase famil protein